MVPRINCLFVLLGNRLPHLTELDISDNFMDPTELTYISQKFRSLRLLVLQVGMICLF